MANDLGKNVWVLDTTGVITTHPVYITSIRWENYTGHEIGDGDVVRLLDAAGGTEIFYRLGTGITNGEGQGFPGGLRVRGLYLDTLANGRLFIYLKTS